MNRRFMRSAISAALLGIIALGPSRALDQTPGSADAQMPIVPETPGNRVAFPIPVAGNPPAVYIKPMGQPDTGMVWSLPVVGTSVKVLAGTQAAYDPSGRTTFKFTYSDVPGVGFIVPNLPKGKYEAWYGQRPADSTGNTGSSPSAGNPPPQPGANELNLLKNGATLKNGQVTQIDKSKLPTLAGQKTIFDSYPKAAFQNIYIDIDPKLTTSQTVVYGNTGTDVQLSVGFAGPGTVQRQGGAVEIHTPAIFVSRTAGTGADLVAADRGHTKTPSTGPTTWTVHIASASETQFTATAPGFESVVIKVEGNQPPPPAAPSLQPGDVLLYAGSSLPFVSPGIIFAESQAFGSAAQYCHAGLYVGKDSSGNDMVAEMGATGWQYNKLSDSVSGANRVDAYRYKNISSAQQTAVANAGKAYGNGTLLYAYPQIAILGEVAAGTVTSKLGIQVSGDAAKALLGGELVGVDALCGGEREMICSELVAWSYHDASLDIAVTPWPKLKDWGVWSDTDLNRRMDYTTPNMLALSPSLQFQLHVK